MSTGSTTALEASEEGRALLQHRVALAGFVGMAFGWGFWLFRVVSILAGGESHGFRDPSLWIHFAAGGFSAAMWLSCRYGTHSGRFVRNIEAACLIGSALGYSAMGATMPPVARPDFIVLCAISFALFARAAYVPSTPRRTAAIMSACALPAIVMTFLVMQQTDVDKWVVVMPDIKGRSATEVAIAMTGFNAAWWIGAVVMGTLTSRIIYGLRREMRTARKLGQYTLHTKLGEGGMGMVYRASHAMLRRPTAVKLLPPEKAGEQALKRFEREVQLTASLSHPNTVTIHDYGRTPDGVFYYAMELLDGATLAEVVELSGAQPIGRVLHTLDRVASALQEAHEVGLIHRDIKPSNIMLAKAGGVFDVPKVLDFGLVKELNQAEASISLTQGDQLTGTPQYLCPEAIRAPETIDVRSDLYSLGAVVYFMITGEHVFTGRTVVEVCSEHLHTTPQPPSERLGNPVPPILEQLVLDCLAKDQADRPTSAREVRGRIQALRAEHRWTETDAHAWWDKYGSGLTHVPAQESAAYEQTIAVAMDERDEALLA